MAEHRDDEELPSILPNLSPLFGITAAWAVITWPVVVTAADPSATNPFLAGGYAWVNALTATAGAVLSVLWFDALRRALVSSPDPDAPAWSRVVSALLAAILGLGCVGVSAFVVVARFT